MARDYASYPDPQLWQAFIDGDSEAFTCIYQRHYKPLFRYGRKLISDAGRVEDCIQELFLELWKNKSTLGATDSIRFYLLKSLRRKIFRKSAHQLPISDLDTDAENYDFTVDYSVEDLIISQTADSELKVRLALALTHLTSRQREAIYLRFYNQMEYQEIAAIMNISYQAIRTLVYRAVKMLREHLTVRLAIFSALCHYMLP